MFKLFKVTIIFLTFFLSSGFFYIGPPFKFSDSFEELSDDTEVVVGITHVLLGDDEEKMSYFGKKQIVSLRPYLTNKDILAIEFVKSFFRMRHGL